MEIRLNAPFTAMSRRRAGRKRGLGLKDACSEFALADTHAIICDAAMRFLPFTP